MKLKSAVFIFFSLSAVIATQAQTAFDGGYARDPKQAVDQAYGEKIAKYTTDPKFLSPLVSYLPAAKGVPTPEAVLGDVAGAPDMLPYAEDVYKYMRLLEKSSPRVKVVTIGKSEEGREMIAVAVADPELLKTQKTNDERLAKLADPRTIGMDDAKAKPLIDVSFPVYYITGTIHSTETGAPTALMELAYRLAVDDAPYIKYIRSHMITLITPVVEVDGRDRMVDIYKWHKANPGKDWPRLTYWGHYVAHDNNRDAMGMSLALTRNVLDTFIGWHAQVLHDLHESVPFLYDNTVGDGPYNPWIDPTLADEWAELGWNNVGQMQSFGMPGVFTHGNFDTWSPGYLMFLAGMHNGVSRLYETFGNGGADTERRILRPEEYSRTWFRQNPPLPVVTWSQRDNNNYEQTALLTTISYYSHHTRHWLENYYEKSKRSITKPTLSGPAAYIFPANTAELNRQLELLRVLKLQHVEIQQLTATATTSVPSSRKGSSPTTENLPAGSFIVRLDQPYSRVADALLDTEYWAPDDPQRHPYDDTGWSFGHNFNVKVVRATDPAILKAAMSTANLDTATGKLSGSGSATVVAHTGQTTLLGLLYELRGAHVEQADAAFEVEGKHFAAGSLLITQADDAVLSAALRKLSLDAVHLPAMPAVAKHVLNPPRIAFMHTWQSTQTEGWWRLAFDKENVPYTYMSTQTAAAESDLRSKYDVIVFAPVAHASSGEILSGLPKWGNALPWQKTDLTPNLILDSTPDTRGGLGYDGLEHLRSFVEKGGLLITCEDSAQFAIDAGLAPGVSVAPRGEARVVGSVLASTFVSPNSPVAYGYGATLPVMSAEGMAFNVSDSLGGAARRTLTDAITRRPTGRGGPGDVDLSQDRAYTEPNPMPKVQPWQARPLDEEQTRNNPQVIPAALRPQVVLRFSAEKDLLLSGLLDHGNAIAERAIVVNAHLGEGNVLLFANNPVYRAETIGSYDLVFNAVMNFNRLKDQHPAPFEEKTDPKTDLPKAAPPKMDPTAQGATPTKP